MKRVLIALVLFLSFSDVTAQRRVFGHLVGRWESVDESNASGGLEVVDSTKIFIVFGDQRKQITDYRLDLSRTPAQFDFIIKDSTGILTMKSLIHFVSDDVVQWQVFEGKSRPYYFASERGHLMYLRRKK